MKKTKDINEWSNMNGPESCRIKHEDTEELIGLCLYLLLHYNIIELIKYFLKAFLASTALVSSQYAPNECLFK